MKSADALVPFFNGLSLPRTATLKPTGKNGFHVTFETGVVVSVQWGPGLYADNYNAPIVPRDRDVAYPSDTAEVAVMLENPEAASLRDAIYWLTPRYTGDPDDQVLGCQCVEQVHDIIRWAGELTREEVR